MATMDFANVFAPIVMLLESLISSIITIGAHLFGLQIDDKIILLRIIYFFILMTILNGTLHRLLHHHEHLRSKTGVLSFLISLLLVITTSDAIFQKLFFILGDLFLFTLLIFSLIFAFRNFRVAHHDRAEHNYFGALVRDLINFVFAMLLLSLLSTFQGSLENMNVFLTYFDMVNFVQLIVFIIWAISLIFLLIDLYRGLKRLLERDREESPQEPRVIQRIEIPIYGAKEAHCSQIIANIEHLLQNLFIEENTLGEEFEKLASILENIETEQLKEETKTTLRNFASEFKKMRNMIESAWREFHQLEGETKVGKLESIKDNIQVFIDTFLKESAQGEKEEERDVVALIKNVKELLSTSSSFDNSREKEIVNLSKDLIKKTENFKNDLNELNRLIVGFMNLCLNLRR